MVFTQKQYSKMLKKGIILLFMFSVLGNVFSQHGVAVGKWKNYFPFRNVIDVVKNGNTVYGATENGIIVADFTDNSVEKLTNINALSDNGISAIAFNISQNTLVVGYSNGNVDLIIGNETINLAQIKSSNLIGDKGVYGIYCKDNLAYISCGFGIVVLNLSKKEVKDTYIIGIGGAQTKVNKVLINNGIIYATTQTGVFKANENNTFLADFNSWTRITSLPLFSNEFNEIVVFNEKLIVNCVKTTSTNQAHYFDGSSWQNLSVLGNKITKSFYVYENKLIVSQYDTILVLDTNYNKTYEITNYDSFWKTKANKVIYDGQNYYIADEDLSLLKVKTNFNAERIDLKGIWRNAVEDIEVEDGQLWGATGGLVGSGWNKTYSGNGVFHYDIRENNWTIYNGVFQGNEYTNITDFVGVAVNPRSPKIGFGCSFSDKGILEFSNNKVISKYDEDNSSLQVSTAHGDRVAVADAVFDKEQNLWAINSWADKPLSVKTVNGTWKSFDCGVSSKGIIGSKIMVDKENGYKWLVFNKKHLLVYNDNKTPLNETDDQYRKISAGVSNGNLGGLPTCVTEDLDGEIWIGTIAGFYVIYNPSEIFESGDFEAQRVKIEQDGNVEYILEAEIITSITIDGGNRKWIGTESSGIYVLSSDGITQIHHFTTENSPILSNNVKDIAIDHKTGEVFISTAKGLISYKAEATEGALTYKDIYAYPNPVAPGYQGKIAITNLIENSDVHISDLAGNVVFATKAIGGQAIWDGNNLDGIRVSSGVYIVFVAGLEGRKKAATKILFMK